VLGVWFVCVGFVCEYGGGFGGVLEVGFWCGGGGGCGGGVGVLGVLSWGTGVMVVGGWVFRFWDRGGEGLIMGGCGGRGVFG